MWSPTVAKHDHTFTAVGIAAGLLGRLLDRRARTRAVVSSVKNVWSTTWSKARPPSSSEFGPNATSPSGMSLVERRVEVR